MKKNKIIFTNTSDFDLECPQPALKFLPEWYKNHDSYINGNKKIPMLDNRSSATIKKCIPVFDALTSGYIITTAVDIYVEQSMHEGKKVQNYLFSNLGYVQTHNIVQVNTKRKNMPELYVPKIRNIWSIQTPKGYSCLFIPPLHRDNVIEIFPGIVDTDTYSPPVEFPFILSDINFEGLIPAGTPIAQVIPFKRDVWKFEIGKDMEKIKKDNNKIFTHFFDTYKKMFWTKKEYL